MMKKKELEHLSSKMEWCTQVVGVMENRMEKEYLLIHLGCKERVFGSQANDSNGFLIRSTKSNI